MEKVSKEFGVIKKPKIINRGLLCFEQVEKYEVDTQFKDMKEVRENIILAIAVPKENVQVVRIECAYESYIIVETHTHIFRLDYDEDSKACESAYGEITHFIAWKNR